MSDDLVAERDRLVKENTYLRGLVQKNPNWKCVHGYDVPTMAHCPSGFPGCDCADDLMLAVIEAEKSQ